MNKPFPVHKKDLSYNETVNIQIRPETGISRQTCQKSFVHEDECQLPIDYYHTTITNNHDRRN